MMYYESFDIVLQEVPGEISLSFLICGCQMRCKGCHSPRSWSTKNKNQLSVYGLLNLLSKYKNTATCVLFMGGEWNPELNEYLKWVKHYNFKTCLYTGLSLNEFKKKHKDLLKNLDYIKTGKYMKELGGLDSETTNQKFYKINKGWILTKYKDLTKQFWKREI